MQIGKIGLGGAQKLAGKACDAATTTSVGNTTAAVVVQAADGVRRGSALVGSLLGRK